jgi:endonuclease/exonuclease/phosphatase family metal-dependent hydrolase
VPNLKTLVVWLLLACLWAGCRGRAGQSVDSGFDAGDAGDPIPDAGDPQDGNQGDQPGDPEIDAGPDGDGTDDPLRIGSASTLELATWNLRNFPSQSDTPELVAELILRLDLDLVFVQEITDEYAFEDMLDGIPTHRGLLSPDRYASGEYQKTGMIYRTGLIEITNSHSILSGDSYAFPRPPFQADISVEKDGVGFTFIAINAHLKAGNSESDEARRRDACQQLKQHVDTMLEQDPATGVLIVGDLNDSIDDPSYNNVFTIFLEDLQYSFLTEPLADEEAFSYISWQRLIDHLLITAQLLSPYQDGYTWVLPLEQQVTGLDFVTDISDHRPVVSVFPVWE